MKYAELPAAWTEGFRTDTFSYRLRGTSGAAGSTPREWTGTQSFHDVEFEGGDAEKFLSLQNVRLTEMSLLSSEAVGDLAILNPLGFDAPDRRGAATSSSPRGSRSATARRGA